MYNDNIKIEASLDYNEKDIGSVVYDLWDDISDDMANIDKVIVSKEHIWVKASVDGELAGYFWLHPYTNTTLQIHVNILKPFRQYSAEISKVARKEIIKHLPDHVDQIVSVIPEIFPNVLEFCLSQGFRLKGCITDIYRVDGIYYSLDILGIPVEEFKAQGAI